MSTLGDALRQQADIASRPGQFSALMDLADRAEKAEAERDRLWAAVDAVRALADDWNGEAEWIEGHSASGSNSMRIVAELRECAAKVRAALDEHLKDA